GDVQRAIIADTPLESPVSTILRPEVRVAYASDDRAEVKAKMLEKRNDFMPVINDKRQVVDVIFWEDLFDEASSKKKLHIDLPVVIMAGGQGSRLRPLTNVLPKPLIPIGDQTMLEDIMDRFVECGCHDFHISVNYKAEVIKQHFENINNPAYN